MKAVVIYDSYTGNTEKVAKEIAKGLNCKSISIDNVDKYKIGNYDLIVIGTPVHAYRPTRKIKKFLSKKEIKHCACFCTYGAIGLGKKSAESCLNYIEKKLEVKCIGKFKCPGFHRFLRMYKDRPDEKDLENAKKFGLFLKEQRL